MSDPTATVAISLLLVTGLAALTDTRSGLIPNTLTLPVLALAPPAHGLLAGPGALGASLLAATLCGLVPLLLFLRGGMGGGDVKLLAAIGALGGGALGLRVQLLAYVLASLYACCRLAWQGRLLSTFAAALRLLWPWAAPTDAPTPGSPLAQGLRMGAPIFAACALVLWSS